MAMDIKEIMSIIPHRQPFLLIDRVEEIVEGESVTAIKNVTYNEPFFAGLSKRACNAGSAYC